MAKVPGTTLEEIADGATNLGPNRWTKQLRDIINAIASGIVELGTSKISVNSQFVSVNDFGAVPDAVFCNGGAITTGTKVLNFTPVSVPNGAIVSGTSLLTITGGALDAASHDGLRIIVPGAGPSGADLVGKINKVISTNQAVLSAVASATVTNKTVTYGGADFKQSNQGQMILIKGASSSDGAGLRTSIASVQNANQVTVTANATTTVTNARVVYGTDNHDAILAAYRFAKNAGKTLVFASIQVPYLSSALEFGGDDTRIDGWGSKLFLSFLPTDAIVDTTLRGGIYAWGNNFEMRNLHVEQAITYDTPQAGYANYELMRIGGYSGGNANSKYRVGCKLKDNTFIGGSGVNVINTSNVTIEDNKVYRSHGNSLGAVNCRGDVVISGNYCENGNDDLIAVTADSGTGQSTLRVSVFGNTMKDGDAGGIKVAGAAYISVANNEVENTYTAAIHVIQDTVFNLQRNDHIIVEGNTVYKGGKCYGPTRYHQTASTAARGIQVDSGPLHVTVSMNQVYDSENRGIQLSQATKLTCIGNIVDKCGSTGIAIGAVEDLTFSKVLDLICVGNTVTNTLGGIVLGSVSGGAVNSNVIRSYYANAPGGQYRGIQFGNCKNVMITANHIFNDDGGHTAIFDSSPGGSVNVHRWGNFILPNTAQVDSVNAFTIGGSRIGFASAAPTTGTYSAGDRFFNLAPSLGGFEGWICTIGGTDAAAKFEPFGQVGPIVATVTGVMKQRIKTGTWITTTGGSTSSGQPANGRFYASPIALTSGVTATSLAINVNTAGSAGSVMRLGIYADDGTTTPSTLILDAGTVDTSTSGSKSITINQTLPAGVYWLVSVSQGSATTQPTLSTIGGNTPGLALSNNGMSNGAAALSADSSTTGALPANAPGMGSNGAAPKVGLGI